MAAQVVLLAALAVMLAAVVLATSEWGAYAGGAGSLVRW